MSSEPGRYEVSLAETVIATRMLDLMACIEQAQRLREHLRVAHAGADPAASLALAPLLQDAARITEELGAIKDAIDAGITPQPPT